MRQLATAAAVLFVLAVPVVTWWLVGDQSTTSPNNADYVLPPLFRVSRRATRLNETFDCSDAASIAHFWSALTGWP